MVRDPVKILKNVRTQERFEATTSGRIAISALCVAIVAAAIFGNIPANSAIKRAYLPIMQPYMSISGLEQNWSLFAPNPRSQAVDLYALVAFDDGSIARWQPPWGEPVFAVYRTYHWRKWVEFARSDDGRAALWTPTAIFAAKQMDGNGRRPVRVSLVRRWYDTPAPGVQTQPRWNEFAYFTLDITREMLR